MYPYLLPSPPCAVLSAGDAHLRGADVGWRGCLCYAFRREGSPKGKPQGVHG